MIPEVNDFIHIKNTPVNEFHLVTDVFLNNGFVECLETDATPLTDSRLIVKFENIDDKRPSW